MNIPEGAASTVIGLLAGLTVGAVCLTVQQRRLRAARRRLTHALAQLRQARHDATHDPLTGLPNRRILMRCLEDLLASNTPFAVAVLDLDGFKTVNDRVDHLFGDEQLVEIAASLAEVDAELVARLGGDEFALVTTGTLAAMHQATKHAQALVERTITLPLDPPVALTLTATVGTAAARLGDTPSTVLHRADFANRYAKRHQLGVLHHP